MTYQAQSDADDGPTEPLFEIVREGDLTLADHEAVAAMLAKAFDSYDHWYQGARSWAGMQPELRVLARSGDVVVAHAGLRRQFVTVGSAADDGADQLVAAVGMVAVSPILQGTGLGRELLRLVDAGLERLSAPFGLLETGEQTQRFYSTHGWEPLDGVTGHYNAFSADGASTLVSQDSGWLLRPCRAARSDWPGGDIHWNGQMV
ncbi:beta-1,4-N-acetylglucosamine oligosaccharide N-acyltransferase NodA [Frondihabitans sp. PhB188]|uniref:GNAT family N-acetyltransferase n=1 Tax=Frondihabitans sp. PhB188 TaxID=2485200 RepID=UPI000F463689|nr:GNAT family N-acetyltransferase [Frondihabitans sp. PhB188]ROQ39902.1 beta-1,4-N-acetylglucosamine oligosaccharide N-acyltransferase NodA [Frondihabitans sp. PhB188]